MTTPDYTSLLDDDVRAFISNSRSFYPDRGQPPTLTERRSDFEAVCAGFAVPYPEGLKIYDTKIANGQRPIAVRWYLPTDSDSKLLDTTPIVVYFHGGGFVLGGLESHDSILADLAHSTGLTVMAVDYALAPEHRFPAACKDALKSVKSCLSKSAFQQIILAGDSAGAWLAAYVAQHLSQQKRQQLLGQLLVYPLLGGDVTKGTYVTHKDAPLLTTQDIIWFYQQFFGPETTTWPKGPLIETAFGELPPTVIFAAEYDPLHDDGLAYARAITSAGGKAVCRSEKGLVHGYLRGRHTVKRIKESFTQMIAALQHLANQSWPYS